MKQPLAVVLVMGVLVTAARSEPPKPGFNIRVIDRDSLEPVASTQFLLIPRRPERDTRTAKENPNLKHAESVETDADGYVHISRSLVDRLSVSGQYLVDCEPEEYAGFYLKRVERRGHLDRVGGPYFAVITVKHAGRPETLAASVHLHDHRLGILVLERRVASEH